MRARLRTPGFYRKWRWLVAVSAVGVGLVGCGSGAPASAPNDVSDRSSPAEGMPSDAWFEDAATEAGLDFRWKTVKKSPMNILEISSAGAGFLDFDQDGRLDIVFVGPEGAALYRNLDGKRFKRQGGSDGLNLPAGRWHGCASADLDNDGFPELLVTGFKDQRLFRNRKGRFVDVTAASGITSKTWGTSASFFDADRDGRLDLLLGSYVKFGPGSPEFMTRNGVQITLGPDAYEADKLKYFKNLGDLRFRDDTRVAGFHTTRGRAFGTATADFDNDGDTDVYVANDEMPGNLYVNDGNGRFLDRGSESGTATSGTGRRQGGMGVAWGDYNNDGLPDLLVTTFTQEPKSLYRNDGGGLFSEVSYETQLTQGILPWVGFGVVFFDANRDGYLDVAMANGHVEDLIRHVDPSNDYPQPLKLFINRSGKQFEDVTRRVGPGFDRSIVGRALAAGDYDNDGDVDLLAADLEGAPVLLRNDQIHGARWIGFRLQAKGRSNSMAIGARVTLKFQQGTQVREVRTDGSYLSTHDPRVVFGLHTYDQIDEVTVRWPDGSTEKVKSPRQGLYYVWKQGAIVEAEKPPG